MTFSKFTTLSSAMAAAILFAVCTATPARAQAAQTVLQTSTSPDGLLTLILSSTNPSDAVGVNNTYTWTAVNSSATVTLTGVVLGSHWGDYCPACIAPVGPVLISMAPGVAARARTRSHPMPILACGARRLQA
jgi:hypothetical protein